MAKKTQQRLGDIIAHWNLEHTDKERKAHLDWARRFLKESGLDKFMTARLVKPSECWCLGWPHTFLDLKLRKRYCNRTYRHRGSGARIINLSVIHVWFTRAAGVYDPDRHADEVRKLTDSCKSEGDAERISAWKGWEGEVCDYTLRTDARYIEYGCRSASRYDGNRGTRSNTARTSTTSTDGLATSSTGSSTTSASGASGTRRRASGFRDRITA